MFGIELSPGWVTCLRLLETGVLRYGGDCWVVDVNMSGFHQDGYPSVVLIEKQCAVTFVISNT